MNTVYLFYKAFCILRIEVALLSCRWSKAWSKAGENSGLIRPHAESVPGLNNREIALIRSPVGLGSKLKLLSLGSELVGAIILVSSGDHAFSTSGDGWGDHPGDISVSLIKLPCIHIYLIQCLTLRLRQDGCHFQMHFLELKLFNSQIKFLWDTLLRG